MIRAQKAYTGREEYEIGRRIADDIRNCMSSSRRSAPFMWDNVITAGVFVIMMKFFSAAEGRGEIVLQDIALSDVLNEFTDDAIIRSNGRFRKSDVLDGFMDDAIIRSNGRFRKPDVLDGFLDGKIPYGALKNILEKLDDGSRIIGIPRGSLLVDLEDSGIFEDKELLHRVSGVLGSINAWPQCDLCEVYLAAAIELVLKYGSFVGSGMSSAAPIPMPIIKILRELSDGKGEMQWYGATSDSILLLPYCTARRAGVTYACFEKERLSSAVIMILLMASGRQRMEVQTASLPCIPRNYTEIIGKCDRAFAFVPAYQILFPERDRYTDYDKVKQCIAWWPEYPALDQWIYVRHIVQMLNEQGIGYVIMPLGLLSRTGGMEKIRARILEEKLLDAVIEFPGGTFAWTNTPFALLIFRKGRTEAQPVYMLNLAGKEGKKLIQVDMRQQEVRLPSSNGIVNLVRERECAEGLSCLVEPDQIERNGYCFGPRAYVKEEYILSLKDTRELTAEKMELERELIGADSDYRYAMEAYERLRKRWEEE